MVISTKEVDKFQDQAKKVVISNPTYTMMQFEFLINIAKLIVAARRAISFTYPIRYYLKGKNK